MKDVTPLLTRWSYVFLALTHRCVLMNWAKMQWLIFCTVRHVKHCWSYHHYSDVTMGRWRLESPASRLLTQPFIQGQMKENIKAPRHWPLFGEFTGDRWIPRTNGQWRGKCYYLMTSSWSVTRWCKQVSVTYLIHPRMPDLQSCCSDLMIAHRNSSPSDGHEGDTAILCPVASITN